MQGHSQRATATLGSVGACSEGVGCCDGGLLLCVLHGWFRMLRQGLSNCHWKQSSLVKVKLQPAKGCGVRAVVCEARNRTHVWAMQGPTAAQAILHVAGEIHNMHV